ncbi:hypothetical protein PybrP1_008320 [[Pythium] brassicae (nom. inval.)]|nr:hypothetical protein PybrP1_008320 [[Pythium] brassicae (nom. inval.)]
MKKRGNLRRGNGKPARLRYEMRAERVDSACPVSLMRLLQWTRWNGDISTVWSRLDAYPVQFDSPAYASCSLTPVLVEHAAAATSAAFCFVILAVLARRLLSAIADTQAADTCDVLSDSSSGSRAVRSKVPAVPLGDKHVPFSQLLAGNFFGYIRLLTLTNCVFFTLRPYLAAVEGFYELRALARQHKSDLELIMRQWTNESMRDTLLLLRAPDPAPTIMATEVEKVFTHSALSCVFLTGPVRGALARNEYFECSMSEVVGYIAGDSFLSDITVMFALHKVCLGLDLVCIIDSLAVEKREQTLPQTHLQKTRLVVIPVNVDNIHWSIMYVQLYGGGTIVVRMYDPLAIPYY